MAIVVVVCTFHVVYISGKIQGEFFTEKEVVRGTARRGGARIAVAAPEVESTARAGIYSRRRRRIVSIPGQR
jgi:hypothetical protein